jgi:hypothetical protein
VLASCLVGWEARSKDACAWHRCQQLPQLFALVQFEECFARSSGSIDMLSLAHEIVAACWDWNSSALTCMLQHAARGWAAAAKHMTAAERLAALTTAAHKPHSLCATVRLAPGHTCDVQLLHLWQLQHGVACCWCAQELTAAVLTAQELTAAVLTARYHNTQSAPCCCSPPPEAHAIPCRAAGSSCVSFWQMNA